MLGIVMLAAALSCVAASAQADSASAPPAPVTASVDPLAQQLQQQLTEQQQLVATVQSLAGDLSAARSTQASLRQLIVADQQSIAGTVQRLQTAEQQYSAASQAEAAAMATRDADRAAEARDKRLLAADIRMRYQDSSSLAAYLLSSTSLSDLLGRAADVSRLMQWTATLVDSITVEAAAAAQAEAVAAAAATSAATAAQHLQLQEAALQQQTDNAESLVAELDVQAAATAQEIRAANTQTLAVAEQIAQTRLAQLDSTIAAAEQSAWQAAEYWVQNHIGTLPASIAVPPATPLTANGSQLAWPLSGFSLTQPFGPTTYPYEPSFNGYAHFHTGIDLSDPLGTPVTAADSGVVVSAMSTTQGYGNYIIIASPGGILTLYGHLQAMLVSASETVSEGQPIGLVGSTGNSTGPHLHFEVRVNGEPIDPIPLLPSLPQSASGP
ncbi:MAG: M23 family metallopeptidase [Candidatus Dormibacteria bacterium]